MHIKEAILQRRSCRDFKEENIPQEVLTDILNAARLSPSAGNAQTHIFGVVKDQKRKEQLAQAAGEQMWISKAPVILAGCADISWDIAKQPSDDFGLVVNQLRFGEDLVQYLSDYPNRRRANTFIHNATPLIPCAQMFLTAVSHGLRACIVGYLDVERASEIFQLPDHVACLFLMPLGYPTKSPKEKALKTIDDIVFYETWD